MVNVRHPDDATTAEPGGRLNLLLSCPRWREDAWAESLPRLLAPMGVQALRAMTGEEATRIITQRPVHIAVVDLGLPLGAGAEGSAPEEGGVRLLQVLSRLASPPPTVVIKRNRARREEGREIRRALSAGAFAIIDRPRAQHEIELLLEVLRRALSRHYQGRWPGPPAGLT
jgi:CheY-like chemotaxis protein